MFTLDRLQRVIEGESEEWWIETFKPDMWFTFNDGYDLVMGWNGSKLNNTKVGG